MLARSPSLWITIDRRLLVHSFQPNPEKFAPSDPDSGSHRESKSRTEKHHSRVHRIDASHSCTKEIYLPRWDLRRRRGWNSARSEEQETASGRRIASTEPRLALCCARCEKPRFCFALRRDRPEVIQCDMMMVASEAIYTASDEWIRIEGTMAYSLLHPFSSL
jgi:hypothetical protein